LSQDIKLFINSPGGSVTAGMGIYDAMQVCLLCCASLHDAVGPCCWYICPQIQAYGHLLHVTMFGPATLQCSKVQCRDHSALCLIEHALSLVTGRTVNRFVIWCLKFLQCNVLTDWPEA